MYNVFVRSILLIHRQTLPLPGSLMPFGSDNALPDNFSGSVKLFPLPNLVLFPGVIQALHIFELRYRKMLEDALTSDKLITMAVTEPSPNVNLQFSPKLQPTVCIGKIITHHQLEDGRFNLLLMGIQRARIVEEFSGDEPYRVARVELLNDHCDASDEQITEARQHLVELFRQQKSEAINRDEELIANLTNPDLPFGMLVDLICFSTGADTQFMYKMLSTQDVWTRHLQLLQLIETIREQNSDSQHLVFPPDFSKN